MTRTCARTASKKASEVMAPCSPLFFGRASRTGGLPFAGNRLLRSRRVMIEVAGRAELVLLHPFAGQFVRGQTALLVVIRLIHLVVFAHSLNLRRAATPP